MNEEATNPINNRQAEEQTFAVKNTEEIGEVKEEKADWVAKAIEYEATPKSLREPKSKMDFINSLGIPRSSYYHEISKRENKKKIVDIWLNEALNGGNEVLEKLKQNALEGKEKSIEMYLKFVLELAENLDIKSDGKSFQVIFDTAFKNYGGNSASKTEGDSPKQG